MSPALDLIRDYLRFVIKFFEVINISAPHIYHSALLLSPRTSIVRRLYKQYTRPFARVIHGLPESWEPISATLHCDDSVGDAVWSPCGEFIAIPRQGSTDILDAGTLSQLSTFEYPPGFDGKDLCFTPDGCFLTQFSPHGPLSWDIQTGGPLKTSQFVHNQIPLSFSSTYSIDGKMIAVARKNPPPDHKDGNDHSSHNNSHSITIFNLFGTLMHTHSVPEGPIIPPIWTHGQCLQFATMKQSFITIWEIAFSSTCRPTEVKSLPVPDGIADGKKFLFFPSLSQLAFTLGDTIQIWDAKASKLLLKTLPEFQVTRHNSSWGSFSFDGCFFACLVTTGVYIWKESPSGYILHQKLVFPTPVHPRAPHFSPNGELIIITHDSKIYLWPTIDQILPPHNSPTGDDDVNGFVLGFSPNEPLVAFVPWRKSVIKILNLQSGDLLLATDMNVEICCMWMTENTVVAVGENGDIVSCDLSGENHTFKPGANIKNSVLTTISSGSVQYPSVDIFGADISLSPDRSWIAVPVCTNLRDTVQYFLVVCDVSTGRCLGSVETTTLSTPIFSFDGHWIWDAEHYFMWEIFEDSRSGTIELKSLEEAVPPPELCPFDSTCGYEVTDDRWVLSPTREQLLWLPQHWRSNWRRRIWNRQFLGLNHEELSDVVILEFFE